jgi:hypothetical protein
MTKFPLPDEAVAMHTAVLGKTGSGKTSTGKLIVENAVDEGYRVCVLDPIKSDWWGLTSSASGKRAGLPFTILGGPRGHVPLHANSGKVLGELVAGGKLPLSILDMAFFRAGEHQKFFIEFAETLMRKMRGVLYLVIEEAHEFAPKERSGIGNESMAIHYAKKLATAGRSKGIRLIIATQRTQALHNALLGSCETMIVHRMTAPADQEPVKKWLKANVTDKDVVAAIDAGMAKQPTGTAWVCSGEADFFEHVKFPLFRTFDNSAAPKKGSTTHDVTMAAVDHNALRDLIGAAIDEAEANDPSKLRARVSDLERRLREAEKTVADPKLIEQAEQRGARVGRLEMRAKIAGKLREFMAKLEAGTEFNGVEPVIIHKSVRMEVGERSIATVKPGSHTAAHKVARGHMPAANGLDGGQLKILEALASCAALGDRAPTRTKVGVFSGYTATGGRFGNLLGSLRTAGMITYQGDTVSLTEAGAAAAPEPDLSIPVRQRLAPMLGPSEGKILDAIPIDGTPIERAAVAEATGYEPTGGRFGNLLGRLRTLGLVEYPDAQTVAATPWLAS